VTAECSAAINLSNKEIGKCWHFIKIKKETQKSYFL
jgi:hypothetical protein